MLHYLAGGGAERVVLRILRLLDRERFDPSLILFEEKGVFLPEVPDDVRIFDLGRYRSGGRWGWIGRFVKILRREKPDLVFSFLWFANLVSIVSCLASRAHSRILVSERVSVDGAHEGFFNDIIRRVGICLLYPLADRVVPNSEAMRGELAGRLLVSGRKIVAIPNPLDIEQIEMKAREATEKPAGDGVLPLVVGMGRLTPQKGFDLLIRSMPLARNRYRLMIIGEGTERERLERLSAGLGLSDRVVVAGFRPNPYVVLAGADLFVLPSRFEGFPNSLVEAMALGVPCVSTRCRTGPEEIITDGRDGLLVPVEDPAALAAAIDRLLEDDTLRTCVARAGRDRIREFDAPRIVRRFEALMDGVTA